MKNFGLGLWAAIVMAVPLLSHAAIPCASSLLGAELNNSQPFQYVIEGPQTTFRDLEPVFKHLISNELFELVIPKGRKLNLFPSEPQHQVRHSQRTVNHYP